MSFIHPPYDHRRLHWPEVFKEGRKFNLKEENIPYLTWLHGDTGTTDCEMDSHSDNSSDEELELWQDQTTEWKRQKDKKDINLSNIRDFMSSCDEDDTTALYDEQVDEIVEFCQQTAETKPGYIKESAVAFLGDCNRSPLGPLTTKQLERELRKPRFPDNFSDREVQATRRAIVISDLDGLAIAALITTASRTQVTDLRDMIYRHLTGLAMTRVKFSTWGIRSFTLIFHAPYYVLRRHSAPRKDHRETSLGVSLRKSFKLPCLHGQNGMDNAVHAVPCIYESQVSFVVTGIDESTWTSYSFVDNYFSQEDSISKSNEFQSHGPIYRRDTAISSLMADTKHPIRNARVYFVKVMEFRLRHIVHEWTRILGNLKMDIGQARIQKTFVTPTADEGTKAKMRREIGLWISETLANLTKFRTVLTELKDTWAETKDYFMDLLMEDDMFKITFNETDHHFREIKSIADEMDRMMDGLRQDYPHNAAHEESFIQLIEAQEYQTKTIHHIRNSLFVTIATAPICITTSMFSTNELLPFAPNLMNFTIVLVALSVIVALSLAMLLNWPRRGNPLCAIIPSYLSNDQHLGTISNKTASVRYTLWDTSTIRSIRRLLPGSNAASLNLDREGTIRNVKSSRHSSLKFDRSPFRLIHNVGSMVERWFRPPPRPGKQRIEWACNCGRRLYIDISADSKEVNRLAAALQCTDRPDIEGRESIGMKKISNASPTQSIAKTKSGVPLTPLNKSSTGSTFSTLVPEEPIPHQSSPRVSQVRSYLELCVNTGQYTKTLIEIDLTDMVCDGDLFARIRLEYTSRRRFRINRWLLKPAGIRFVKFKVQGNACVGILQEHLSIPPPEYVSSGRYDYRPCPLEDPPMPSDLFLHYLTCEAPEPRREWLQRLPKKLEPSVCEVLNDMGLVDDVWGVHIIEGPNWLVVGFINLFLLSLSGLAAGLWSRYNNDFQGAFGFAGWIVAVVNAVLLVYIAKWSRG